MTEKSVAKPPPTPMPKAVLCPYCGSVSRNVQRCDACQGHLDALSRQATQNGMGPWQVHNAAKPFAPGCSYEVLHKLIDAGRVSEHSVIRGPTTGQFWMLARRVPGVSHLVGWCHSCQTAARKDEYACRSCGAVFSGDRDRQHLGLGPIRPLPGEGSAELIAARASYALPAVPTPTPGAARASAPTVNGSVHAPADVGRIRTLERRVVVLRSRVMMCVGVIVVLGCALAAALVLLSINRPQGEPLTAPKPVIRDPAYLGPGLIPADESEPMQTESPAVEDTVPTEQPEPEAAIPERVFDITLLAWPDAELEVKAMIDPSSAESLAHGIDLLKRYDETVGLPESGRELLEAWTYRLEQLRLNGLP